VFKKVLIANRGAIAVRVIRTLNAMGVTAAAVYAEADADSLHVRRADESYCLGTGNAAVTYLDQDKLFALMETHGVDAVHPGYGFLSENAGFAQRCADRDIAFLGPTPEQMRAFGLKHSARRLAEDNHVPLLPGSDLLDDVDAALHHAVRIGYPVMLKSTAGGGGIGMQRCADGRELAAAFESVKRLGEANFADGGVFLEKLVVHARHVEVQIFGDGRGGVVALGERDCSVQRRNQKVIEETPAPGLPEPVRGQLHAAAVRLAEAVNYRSAGTVEFIYNADDQACYFLEMNTRLQVEHGVTEQVYGIDLVEWMVRLGAGELPPLSQLRDTLRPRGHAIQARLYAEDPAKQFQPSAGLLTHVDFPAADGRSLRIDHWIEAGLEVSPLYDPMLAKVIAAGDDRDAALGVLRDALARTQLSGIETNRDYLLHIIASDPFRRGGVTTAFLAQLPFTPARIEVISPGTLTTVQDYPGRTGYWDVGVPPSGPFDDWSFRLGNRLLDNPPDAAGMEITLNGPTLLFYCDVRIVLAGAPFAAHLDGSAMPMWRVIAVSAGRTLHIGKVAGAGARAYLLVKGGIQCARYLGSRSTFTLGQFGGHGGRALRTGDMLAVTPCVDSATSAALPEGLVPEFEGEWTLRVIYGPHGAPDFFTPAGIETFITTAWEVHYHSSRTGVRLVGPKPEWARGDGGEAGLHPSNIHDNAYAVGTVDFTGDMPVILGPDGPSLGGFVCPATVIKGDRWKIGQLKAGDRVRFVAVTVDDAVAMARAYETALEELTPVTHEPRPVVPASPVVKVLDGAESGMRVTCRVCGDNYLLVEYGDMVLDIALRFRVHALMLWLRQQDIPGVRELTPGVRSLQVHYDSLRLPLTSLLSVLERGERSLRDVDELVLPARVVHLPLSWDDAACRLAIEKYMQAVRGDAPWCPSNIEFIRRINGLESVQQVKDIVFSAEYLVMGLGDVYLGAPVATPLDPRQRLVTTKYNPARTWTAENSVGIGGSYLCIYGMEGPGGYQFVGRTVQMWNRYRRTREFDKPWLLRFFDRIRFYEVDGAELLRIRARFPRGDYPLRIEPASFSLKEYRAFLGRHAAATAVFTARRERAFAAELQHWHEQGLFNFTSEQDSAADVAEEQALPGDCRAIESHVAGSVWQILVKPGDRVTAGQPLVVLESMKMEIEVVAPAAGTVFAVSKSEGQQVAAGQCLLVLRESDPCM
jgi:urea carboxylase